MKDLLAGFDKVDAEINGITIRGRMAGSGPPLLMLHGYPQTHLMWHEVAPALTETHTVVLTDLRGYGASSKPVAGADHAEYGKRAMAADQVALMASLGYDRFAAVGHDRGARVLHRMCLDHPEQVERVAVLDIAPTRHVLAAADMRFGLVYEHWFSLAQPPGFPEHLIGQDPEFYLRTKMAAWSGDHAFHPQAMRDYVENFRDPATIAASCEDYRACVSIDLDHDDASYLAGERVRCPLLALWGSAGFVGQTYDMAAVWGDYATDVSTAAVDAAHFVAEEAPAATLAALVEFLG